MSDIIVEVTGENQVTIQYPGPAGVGVPAGGTTNQVLAKASNVDYDTTWVTGGGGQTSVQFQDEGTNLGTSGTVDTLNFTGAGVTATRIGNTVTANVAGGGGSGDVVGPISAVDSRIAAFDGITGKLIKDSGSTVAGIVALIPDATSDLINDSGFITSAGAPVQSVNGNIGVVVLDKTSVGLGNVDNTSDTSKPVSTAQQTALNLKANLAGPTFTGTVSGITKAMVGLSNVDNTSDASKPVSTAQQTALNLKANLASPTFTGTVVLPAGQVVNGVTLTTAGAATNFLNATGAYSAPAGGGGQASIQFQDEGSNLGATGTVDTVNFVGTGVTASRVGNTVTATITSGGGSGDVVGPASSVDSEVVLFNSTTGKLIKSATQTGRPKLTAGVLTASNIDLTSEVTGVLPNANGGKFTPIINNYTSSTTMADPGVGCSIIRVRAIGGGGGGGSGRKNTTTAGRAGGAGGSAGGFVDVEFKYSDVPSWPVTITIGAGGSGAAGQATNGAGGIAGTAGGDTTFDALVTAKGGLGGPGGGSVTVGGGRARSGSQTAIITAIANAISSAGGQSGATAASITAGAGGYSGSGGGGGGLTTGNGTMAGGDGGMNQNGATVAAGGTAGNAGTNGADGDTTAPFISPFGGGGSGAGSSITTALAGGNGGLYGAGGGGGNAGTDSVNNSGAGGNGAQGFMQVIAR